LVALVTVFLLKNCCKRGIPVKNFCLFKEISGLLLLVIILVPPVIPALRGENNGVFALADADFESCPRLENGFKDWN
jgi:hypothetical protein